jgi:hypothetical protein
MVNVLDDCVTEDGAGDALPGVRDGVVEADGGAALVCCAWGLATGGETADEARADSGSRGAGGCATVGAGFDEPPMLRLMVGGGAGGGASGCSGRAKGVGGGCWGETGENFFPGTNSYAEALSLLILLPKGIEAMR